MLLWTQYTKTFFLWSWLAGKDIIVPTTQQSLGIVKAISVFVSIKWSQDSHPCLPDGLQADEPDALSALMEKCRSRALSLWEPSQALSLGGVLFSGDWLALHSSSPKRKMSYVTMNSYSLRGSMGGVQRRQTLSGKFNLIFYRFNACLWKIL